MRGVPSVKTGGAFLSSISNVLPVYFACNFRQHSAYYRSTVRKLSTGQKTSHYNKLK